MSRNVFSTLPHSAMLLMTPLVFTLLAWTSARTATGAWNPPPAAVGHGLCSRACEVDACLGFATPDAEAERRCVSEAALRLKDLRRAGPDQACVQQCARHGSPIDLSLLDGAAAGSPGPQ